MKLITFYSNLRICVVVTVLLPLLSVSGMGVLVQKLLKVQGKTHCSLTVESRFSSRVHYKCTLRI